MGDWIASAIVAVVLAVVGFFFLYCGAFAHSSALFWTFTAEGLMTLFLAAVVVVYEWL
jgi:hypothetical protein